MNFFETMTGRKLTLEELTAEELEFLSKVQERYGKRPTWNTFGSWWPGALERAGLGSDSLVYRICQDLEARLGVAEGRVAVPDYRDYLADLIEERYGSRYRFCKETGIDPGHLSRVFSSRSDLSLQALQRVLEVLQASLVIRPRELVVEEASPEHAREALAAVGH